MNKCAVEKDFAKYDQAMALADAEQEALAIEVKDIANEFYEGDLDPDNYGYDRSEVIEAMLNLDLERLEALSRAFSDRVDELAAERLQKRLEDAEEAYYVD